MEQQQIPEKQIKAQKHIPIDLIVDLSNKGISYSQVSKLLGCSKSNVINRLKSIGHTHARLDAYKQNRADIFALMGQRMLNSITDSEIKEISVKERIVSTGILFDKERLERGQSTSNSAILYLDTRTSSAALLEDDK